MLRIAVLVIAALEAVLFFATLPEVAAFWSEPPQDWPRLASEMVHSLLFAALAFGALLLGAIGRCLALGLALAILAIFAFAAPIVVFALGLMPAL